MSILHGHATPGGPVGELVVTIGLPACGKSTWAKRHVKAQMSEGVRTFRLNRDDYRLMGLEYRIDGAPLQPLVEEAVTIAQHAAVRALLLNGWNVVSDDTNLRPDLRLGLSNLARDVGARYREKDFRWVPPTVCVASDIHRGLHGGHTVGSRVIHDLAARHVHESHYANTTPQMLAEHWGDRFPGVEATLAVHEGLGAL